MRTAGASERRELLRSPARFGFPGSERDFEDYAAGALPEIFERLGLPPIRKVFRQCVVRAADSYARLDIAVAHTDGSISVAEVKKVNDRSPRTSPAEQCKAIGQMLLYRSLLRAQTGAYPRMFLVDTKIHPRTLLVFSELQLPVTLVEIQGDRVFVPYMPPAPTA